jgi:vitamin B12 transporter
MTDFSFGAAECAALFIGLGFAASAAGQEAAQPSLTPMVVTATLIDTPMDQVGSSISLITAADISDHQWRTLPDALMTTPGLNVVQTGGPGGLTSVFIRGANANHTKVIIDGVDAEDPSTGAFDFGQVLTSDLARVEILRGPSSSLYGSDALGGVINIVTEAGSGPAHIKASVEGGSFDTINETFGVAGSSGKFSYSFNLAHDFSGDTPITPAGLLAPGEKLVGDRYDNLTASTKLNYQVSPILSFGLVARFVDADLRSIGENYNVFPAIPDAAPTDQLTRQVFARAETRLSLFDNRFQNVFGVGYTYYQTTIQSPDDGSGLPAPTIDDGDRLKFDWQGTLKLSPIATLVTGADLDFDRLINSPITARDGYQAAFAELDANPVQGLNVALSVRDDHDNRFGNAATWRVAPTYTIPVTGTQIKASYGTGFKAPTLTQLFVSFPAFDFYANPNLKPETSRGYDIGFEQPLLGDRLRFGATWFDTVIKNLIDSNADFTSYANIGRATTYGVETFISAELTRRLSLRADYTYTLARDDMTNLELLRRPKDVADLTGTWRPTDRLQLSATLLYKGGWVDGSRDFSVPRLMASPYATANVSGSYQIGPGVSLFARVDNLLNRHYQDPVGFAKPGIGAFGGVTVDLAASSLGLGGK